MGGKLNTISPKDTGFSLIELLVVISVLAVLSAGVTITATRRGSDVANPDFTWFQRNYEIMNAFAIEGRQSKGLILDAKGAQVARKTLIGWELVGDEHRWINRVTILRDTTASLDPNQPDIVFLANGQTNVFSVTFSSAKAPASMCQSDGWTGLICDGN
jgi:prepilin-type N-terminal cleavage/methylation domain-containing protein